MNSMPQTATESLTYREAVAHFRTASTDAIEAFIESASYVIADPQADPVEFTLAQDRTRAAEHELRHRQTVAHLRSGTATKHDQSRDAWTALARIVRERVEVPAVLRLTGLDLQPAGRSRGRDEYSSACPICRDGTDRLRAWSGPNGRAWCRQCRWSTDVIGAASLIVGTGEFRDCVRFLAEYAGVEGGGR